MHAYALGRVLVPPVGLADESRSKDCLKLLLEVFAAYGSNGAVITAEVCSSKKYIASKFLDGRIEVRVSVVELRMTGLLLKRCNTSSGRLRLPKQLQHQSPGEWGSIAPIWVKLRSTVMSRSLRANALQTGEFFCDTEMAAQRFLELPLFVLSVVSKSRGS